jgi:hypothetical protein
MRKATTNEFDLRLAHTSTRAPWDRSRRPIPPSALSGGKENAPVESSWPKGAWFQRRRQAQVSWLKPTNVVYYASSFSWVILRY